MRFLCLLASAVIAAAQPSHDRVTLESTFVPADHPAIDYYKAPLNDPVTRLSKKLEAGQARLEYREGVGYLPSLLENLGVNPDSQMLVFSKTSFQAAKISPANPRALYFNDEVQIGYVRGGEVMEIVALDPKLGDIFYTLDASKAEHPTFDRRDVCMQCHLGPATLGVPGIMVASVYADSSGMPAFRLGEPVTDHRTPFGERWGGWYVTGTHGSQHHRGNAVSHDPRNPGMLDIRDTQNLTSLAGRFDPRDYLSAASDIVALMTLEHQTRITNLLTRIGWEARIAERDQKSNPQLDADVESAVSYMLFADEAPLREPVGGVSTFTKTFPQRGPRDHQGRSLRDFDLRTRLFRYPLSYMIYSTAFDGLPDSIRTRLSQRLWEVLTGKDHLEKFARLTGDDKKAILEILRDTKPALLRGFPQSIIDKSR
jgi:hypothetical protein